MANPLVALEAQVPDIAGSMIRGQAAQESLQTARLSRLISQSKLEQDQIASQRANQLQQLYQQHGQDLIGQDEGAAQNALSEIAKAAGPEEAGKAATARQNYLTQQFDATKNRLAYVGQLLNPILQAPPEKRAAMYGQALEQAKAAGINLQNVPQTYDEDWVKQRAQSVLTTQQQMEEADKARTAAETSRHNVATETQASAQLGQQGAQLAETGRHNKATEGLEAQKVDLMSNASLPDDTLTTMAQQYLAGDKSVLQNLGRGTQGSANIVRLRGKIAQMAAEKGMSGADIAQAMAEFSGLTAGERALGTRTATIGMAVNEAQQVAPLAIQASRAVSRSKFVPFTQAEQMVQRGTNDPDLRRFVAANNALVNVYARAINPTGVPTEGDKNHARDMLNTTFDQKSYEAVVAQMMQEMEAAQRAPAAVRQEFRYGTENQGTNSAPSIQAPAATPSAQDIVDELRKRGVVK